jgi:uncharacterized protein
MASAGSSVDVATARPISARIEAVDILRGLALLGVLAINLDTEFRVTFFEQFLPSPVSAAPIDRAVDAFLKTAIEFKAFSLFSLLFGMGLAMQFEHLAGRRDRLTLLIRRLLALLAFGLIHFVFIWNGDILTEYALAGFVVLPLLFAPAGIVAVSAGAALVSFLALPWLPISFGFPDRAWLTAHVAVAREVYAHGTFSAILAFRVSEIPCIASLHAYVFARTVALMLFGGLVWRSGLIADASKHGKLIGGAAIALLGLGALLSLLVSKSMAPVGLALEGASAILATTLLPVLLAIGYAALVIWVVNSTRYRSLLAWAAPVGRMAFTNYITETVLLGLIFFGYGLGLMGKLGIAAAFAVGLTLYTAQVFLSRWWLQLYLFGPLEWLWRTIMYGKSQPWRRQRSVPVSGLTE